MHVLAGTGATPEGNRPFLDLLDVATGQTRRLWQSAPPFFEYTLSLLNDLDDAPIRWGEVFVTAWVLRVSMQLPLPVEGGALLPHAVLGGGALQSRVKLLCLWRGCSARACAPWQWLDTRASHDATDALNTSEGPSNLT